ncbi:ribosome-associated translation inhibitor RaiA [Patescibacteria group bacterium]|nr:ribosome-associated translation inhibitor RaiA [Patescibacteria group bacterium]
MNVQIKAENLTLDERLKSHVREKVHMLTKYLGDVHIIDTKVKVSLTSKHHQKGDIYTCEMALTLPGETLRVNKTTSDIFKAVDKVKDHLVPLIKKYKEKNA